MNCLTEDEALRRVHGTLEAKLRLAVDAHAAECDPCRSLVADLVRWAASAPVAEADEAPAATGTRVDRYLVLDCIGAGAMGVVYAAYDPKLDRKVCLKLLRADLLARGGPGLEERLIREARAMARLTHPNVLSVYDAGTTGERVFLVMEHAGGGNLAQWLSAEQPSAEQILQRFLDAGRGLAAAHEANLVHRDFKPTNVLIRNDGGVCVADFGLALTASAPLTAAELRVEASDEATQIWTGHRSGTPAYMSPEQIDGLPADARSDQFSFCVALYEALVGKRPFGGTTMRERRDLMDAGPTPASNLHPRVWKVLTRGLRASPAERFDSMASLLSALDQARRRRKSWRVAAAVLSALLVSGGVLAQRWPAHHCSNVVEQGQSLWNPARRAALVQAFEATKSPLAADTARRVVAMLDEGTQAWTDVASQVCRSSAWTLRAPNNAETLRAACLEERRQSLAAVVDVFSSPDAASVERAVKAVGGLPPATDCLGGELLGRSPPLPLASDSRKRALQLRADLARASALHLAGKYPLAKEAYAKVTSAAREVANPPLLADALAQQGLVLIHTGAFNEAKPLLEEAVKTALEIGEEQTAIRAWLYLASSSAYSGEDTRRSVVYAEALFRRIGSPAALLPPLERAWTNAYMKVSDWKQTLVHAEREVSAAIATWGPEDQRVGEAEGRVALAAFWLGDFDRAVEAQTRAINLIAHAVGPDHPSVAHGYQTLSATQEQLGRYDLALADAERASGIFSRTLPADNRLRLRTEFLVWLLRGMQPNAPDVSRSARVVLESIRETNDAPLSLAELLEAWGHYLLYSGHPQEALRASLEGHEILTRAGATASLDNFDIAVGRSYVAVGRYKEARPFLERVVAKLTPDDPPTACGLARAALARARAAMGERCEDVTPLLKTALENFTRAPHDKTTYAEKARVVAWLEGSAAKARAGRRCRVIP